MSEATVPEFVMTVDEDDPLTEADIEACWRLAQSRGVEDATERSEFIKWVHRNSPSRQVTLSVFQDSKEFQSRLDTFRQLKTPPQPPAEDSWGEYDTESDDEAPDDENPENNGGNHNENDPTQKSGMSLTRTNSRSLTYDEAQKDLKSRGEQTSAYPSGLLTVPKMA